MNVLEVKGLSKTFRTGRRSVDAVRGLSLSVNEGEILAFLGPNGAGKTTTIKMIAGLIRPDSGSIRVLGKDPQKRSIALRDIGAVLEGNRNIYWRLAPEENMEYFGVLKGLPRREARRRAVVLLERFGLGDKRGITSQKLSRGMQQQVALAVALIHRPKLLLLDEPTLGLDVRAAERMKQVIREAATEGRAVLLTTHQLAVAEEIAHRVAIIDRGEIVAEEATPELLERFSGEGYRIELGTALTGALSERLVQLGASVDGSSLEYVGDADGLYRVFELLRPLPIVRVEKAGASLTDVFLHLTDDPTGLGEDGDV
ncbi:MAG: ABC transporter ATP-binding protein [bacterium]|nr:ABC transporter ATP-binding protein [bacterium]